MTEDRSIQFELLDQLADEFAARFRLGERPALTEYTSKYPELSEEIRELFPAMVTIEQVDEDRRAAADRAERATESPLRLVGDYRIVREIGRGGMGVVYEAEQRSLGRRVALKVLPFHAKQNADALERFRREARALARLHHSNIVPVFEVGQDQDVLYYAMQLIQGQGLDQVLVELQRMKPSKDSAAGRSLAETLLVNAVAHSSVSVAEALLTGQFPVPNELFNPNANGMGASGDQSPDGVATPDGVAIPAHADGVAVKQVAANGAGNPQEATVELSGDATAAPSVTLPGQAEFSSVTVSNPQHYYISVARLCIQVAEALAYAHGKGVIHRDIKPSNLLLDKTGTVWVTDFGLAKAEGDALTKMGDVVGTIRYMAPERFRGWSDPRSDVYGLGMTLYELLVLRPAFDCPDQLKLIQQVTHDEPPRPRSLDGRIPSDLETIVLKAINKEPGRRYQTAGELAEDLKCFVECRPIHARRVSRSERAWRLCQRNPVVSALIMSVAVLLVLIAGGSFATSVRLRAELKRVEQAERAEKEARREAVEKLGTAYQAQARAGRFSRQMGQRFESLQALSQAAKIARELGMSETRMLELRNEAIACMALPDVKIAKEWNGYPDGSWHLDFDGALNRYARTNRTGEVSVRRVVDDTEIAGIGGLEPGESYPLLSRDGQFLAVVSPGGRLRLWSLAGNTPELLVNEASVVSTYNFSPDSRLFAFGLAAGPLSFIELPSGQLLRQLDVGPLPQYLVFHPQERQFAVGINRTMIRLCDMDSGSVLAELPEPSAVMEMDWHPDGKMLAVVGNDLKVHLWDVTTQKPGWVLEGFKNQGIKVRFNRTGDLLCSNDWNGTLRLWDPGTGRQLFQTQGGGVMRFSPDDRLLAADIKGNTLRLWEVAAGREYRTLVRSTAFGKTQYFAPSISPDGRLLAVGMWDGFGLWDLATGQELAIVQEFGRVFHLRFEASGSLLTNDVGAGLLRWQIPTAPASLTAFVVMSVRKGTSVSV